LGLDPLELELSGLLAFGMLPFGLELAADRSSLGCCAGRLTPNTPDPRSVASLGRSRSSLPRGCAGQSSY
jgi:hypothetical protein